MTEETNNKGIILNLQQELFLKHFLDPKSETFSNYLQSALKAGYSQEYAETISYQMPKWLDEALEDSTIVRKAMDNLSEFLGDEQNKNLQWDATKFTLSRLNKGKFSEETETDLTSKGEKITWNEQKTYLNETIIKTNTGS